MRRDADERKKLDEQRSRDLAAKIKVVLLLLPLSPLWGAVAVPRSRLWRRCVLVACLAGQWGWIHFVYALGNTYWQVP